MRPVPLSGCFRSVAFCEALSRAEATRLSKVTVAARSWAGLQPGFISFTPECQRNGERLCPCVARVNCRENADIAVE
jgi:hypothetical protein